jgi:Legionella pneumophila major outer membrane protein precursor
MSLRAGLVVTAVILGSSISAAQAPDGPPPGGPVPVPSAPTAAPPRLLPPAPSDPPPGLPALPPGPPALGNAPAPVLVPRPDFMYWQDAPPPQQPPPPPWRLAPPPGWFVGLEASPTLPRINFHEYHHRGQNLDWTVAPRFTLGYRFEHGGSVLLSYRNLTSQATFFDFADALSQRVRLNANWLDLTYLSRNYVLGPHLRWQWETGVRSAYLYSDVRNQWPDYVGTVRDTFGGAGPHAGVRFAWWFGDSGWSLFGRLDGAVLFGGTRENGSAFAQDDLGNVIPWAGSRTCHCGVVDGRFELGLGYVVPTRRWLRLDVGFQTEVFSWQDITFSDRGPFVRCVIGF